MLYRSHSELAGYIPNSSVPARPTTKLPRDSILNPAVTTPNLQTKTLLFLLGPSTALCLVHAGNCSPTQHQERQSRTVKRLQFPACPRKISAHSRMSRRSCQVKRGSTLNLTSPRGPGGPDSPCNCDSASPRDAYGETYRGRSWISHRPVSAVAPLAACAAWPC